MTQERLGPAERIIATMVQHVDHLCHNRPGFVKSDNSTPIGVSWQQAYWKEENGEKFVYVKQGKSVPHARVGLMQPDKSVTSSGVRIGRFRDPGIFPEVAAWLFRQVAEVYKLDNEFAARWASYVFTQEHRDMKVLLAAFMLVQSRKGEPVLDGGKVAFHDEDFREVGEAMILLDGKHHFDLKMVLRVRALLQLPEIAAITRELGFGHSARTAFLGRYERAAERWLRYRENNPKLLDGLVKKGFASKLRELARAIHYKPSTPKFFEALRWKQGQSADGRRSISIGKEVAAAESWAGFTEEQVCERIVASKPDFKRIVGMLPATVGLTRAVMAAAIEAGSLSDKDIIIQSPTLEELGLLEVPGIKERWQAALKKAEDQRAANIAARMKTQSAQTELKEAADAATAKAVEEVVRDMRIYVAVDVSGSMEGAIEKAKIYVTKLLPAFPIERLHVSVFNTAARELALKHASAAAVENAFGGLRAGGGTDYGKGVLAFKTKPLPTEDALMIFIGDEVAGPFWPEVRQSGINPIAFGLVPTPTAAYGRGAAVTMTALELGIPCFEIDEKTFDDPYAVPRILRNMIAATPVRHVRTAAPTPRMTLVDQILACKLLRKPAWAA